MRSALSSILMLLALIVLSSGMIGGFSQAVLNAISIVLMVAIMFSTFSLGTFISGHSILALVGSVLAVAWIVFFPSQGNDSRLLMVVVFCFSLSREHSRSHSSGGTSYVVVGLSGLLVFVASSTYHTEPLVWSSMQIIAKALSSAIGNLTGQPILFGSTASGLMVSFVFVLFGLGTAFVSKHPKRFVVLLKYGLSILILNAVFISLVHPATRWIQSLISDATLHPMNLLCVLLVMDLVPTFWFVKRMELSEDRLDVVTINWKALGVTVVCMFLWGAISWRSFSEKENPSREIFIYDRGYLNWDKPVFGRYGIKASGMFGVLPTYLDAMGYQVKRDSILTEESVRSVGVIVVVNLNRRMPDGEKARIRSFVSNGGSLLVLGDHTDIGGMMGPLNDLLEFVKARFRFDCGHYLKKDWRDSYEFMPHPIFAGVRDEVDVGISVGASLDCSPLTGRPLLVAKYGFSDLGDSRNEKEAFLGDRRYNAGELLGDIVLIAEAGFGKGKVLIFGDTSPFQNGALPYSFNFVENVFRYLSTSGDSWNNVAFRILSLLLLVLGVGVQIYLSLRSGQAGTALWVSAILLISVALVERGERPISAPTAERHRLAYIDASQLNRFSQHGKDGIWALTYHLMRNGYLPVVRRVFSTEWLQSSSVAFFISPANAPTRGWSEVVDSYTRHGGVAVWSFGYEEKEPVSGILTKYGIDIDNVPLGPIPEKETSRGVGFYKAWPIEIVGNSVFDTLCTGWGYPVIVAKTLERGKICFVSDPGFFLSENLELNHSSATSNPLFLHTISSFQTTNVADSRRAASASTESK